MNNELCKKVSNYYMACRHYNDETACYTKESWESMTAKLYKTFETMYTIDRETGNTVLRTDLTDEVLELLYQELQNAERQLVPLHDPEEDKIYLWEPQNMPWDLINEEEWKTLSYDAPDFRPHMTKHLVDDCEKHPAVIICGGRYRCNGKEGRPIAEILVQNGYHAFVLNNRMGAGDKIRRSLERALDLQRAIRILRAHADEMRINPARIAFWGLSMGNRAGIDLINRLGYESDPQAIDPSYQPDEIDRINASLNAYISEYPATFPWEAPNRYEAFPPTFGIMGNRDFSIWRVLPFFTDLIINKCAVELHVYDGVAHGFGTGDYRYDTLNGPYAEIVDTPPLPVKARTKWTDLLFMWLNQVFDDNYKYKWPIDQIDI